jgi:hypothetical protein
MPPLARSCCRRSIITTSTSFRPFAHVGEHLGGELLDAGRQQVARGDDAGAHVERPEQQQVGAHDAELAMSPQMATVRPEMRPL